MTTLNEGKLEPPKKEPPQFSPEAHHPPQYGVLVQLEGTWVNYNPGNDDKGWGLHTTSLPSPGTNSESMPGKFHFICENYTEELTFKLVDGGVRNRGGTNEQFCGAVEYNQSIQAVLPNGTLNPIHEENGMYLWLRDTYIHPVDDASIKTDMMLPELVKGARGETFLPQHSIARSGTIPHGSTMQLIGSDYKTEKGEPKFPKGDATWDSNHLTIHPSMAVILDGEEEIGPNNLDNPPPEWVKTQDLSKPSARAYIHRIFAHDLYPHAVRPDLRLRDAIAGQEMKDHTLIHLGTKFEAGPQGGVINTPLVQKYCPVTEVQYRMWIETVIEDGEEILQLQYEQICFFEFSFFVDGSLTRWPHIQVNTLRKKDWVDKQNKK